MSRKMSLLMGAGVIFFLLAGAGLAAVEGFDLSWWTVDGGGGTSGGAGYSLQGTTGQPDAGYRMTGGGYTLAGGFWGAGGPAPTPSPSEKHLYLPLIHRQ